MLKSCFQLNVPSVNFIAFLLACKIECLIIFSGSALWFIIFTKFLFFSFFRRWWWRGLAWWSRTSYCRYFPFKWKFWHWTATTTHGNRQQQWISASQSKKGGKLKSKSQFSLDHSIFGQKLEVSSKQSFESQ